MEGRVVDGSLTGERKKGGGWPSDVAGGGRTIRGLKMDLVFHGIFGRSSYAIHWLDFESQPHGRQGFASRFSSQVLTVDLNRTNQNHEKLFGFSCDHKLLLRWEIAFPLSLVTRSIQTMQKNIGLFAKKKMSACLHPFEGPLCDTNHIIPDTQNGQWWREGMRDKVKERRWYHTLVLPPWW